MMEGITDQQIEKGLQMLRSLQDGKLMTHVNSCVHCGLCGESCLYYLANKEARFLPAMKVDLVSSVYKRYFTFTGRVFPKLINARDLDQETTEEMVDLLFGACTMCGRCNIHCSIGVDIAFLVRTGRMMLTEMGLTPVTLQSTVNAALTTGNNMGITKEEFVDTLNWLEEDLRDEVNDPEASIPLNEKGKKLMYTLNPREPKFFPLSISAMAKVFYAAKESWTLSTEMYDVTNYAFFSGNPKEAKVIADRMHAEFKNLGAKELVLAECGHGDRAYRWEAPNYNRKNELCKYRKTKCAEKTLHILFSEYCGLLKCAIITDHPFLLFSSILSTRRYRSFDFMDSPSMSSSILLNHIKRKHCEHEFALNFSQ